MDLEGYISYLESEANMLLRKAGEARRSNQPYHALALENQAEGLLHARRALLLNLETEATGD